jgi:tripartite-type tricarboxylate transporter receptor subunit TctC
MPRRRIGVSAIPAIAALAAFLMVAANALAQNYPVRPVKLIVPSSPGGGSDFIGRVLAQKLSDGLRQQVVVENRPGASSVIGADFVAKSAPDGYTVLISPAALAINPHMYATMPFDTRRDLAPVTLVVQTGNLLSAHPSLPVRGVKELIALARKNPGKLACASPGLGGSPHMAAELFKVMAGLDFLIVSYKGSGPGTVALLSGEVSFMFATPPSSLPFVRTGRLRALGVTTRARMPGLPEVPSLDEAGLPGYEATQWFGLLVPAGTPRPIIDRLHEETLKAIRAPDMKERFTAEGLEGVGSRPEDFAAYIHAELEKWAKVIRSAGIKPQGGAP